MNDILDEKMKNKLRPIMRNHDLAKFGDILTNFIYSLAKTKMFNTPFGEHVFDKSLAEAIKSLQLRDLLQSNIATGEIADGAEALIGYAYLNKIMSVDDYVEKISAILQDIPITDFENRSREKELITLAFKEVLKEIIVRMIQH